MIKISKISKAFIVVLFLSLLGLSFGFWKLWDQNIRVKDPNENIEFVTLEFESSGLIINAEVARTPEARATGLMNRDEMAPDAGMLFIFDEDVQHGFWMKDTLIPLDMLFLDVQYRIVDIIADVPPCTTQYCRTYTPSTEYRYVLELNAGLADEEGIRIGDKIFK